MHAYILLIVVALISFFFIKYFNSEDPVRDTESEYVWVTRKIEEVLVMFPNADTSQVAYDLSRHRSVEGCISKLLANEALEEPPRDSRYYGWDLKLEGMDLASARTTKLRDPPTTTTTTTTQSHASGEPSKDELIKQYNLQNRTYVESVPEDD